MADTRLLLGDFEFQNFEIPERIPFGGAQQLVTHRLPGGARVIQAMGHDHAPIGWSGLLLGADATPRARRLDQMRVAGAPVNLSWGDFSYTVYIESFTAQWERPYQIPYQVSCVIQSDAPKTTTGPGFDQTIRADNALAQSLGPAIGDSVLTTALGAMDSAITSVSTFAGQATTTINGILGPVGAVLQRVQTLKASVTNTVNNIASLGGVMPNTSIAQAANRLTSQMNAATQLSALSQLGSVAGRITTNLNMAGGAGANLRQIVTVGGNLFDKAAALYGDATRWTGLAKANGTVDPSITGVTTLNVPKNPPDNGGTITT